MPVTISGSSGIRGADGSAGNPALTGSDADTGFFLSAGQISASLNGVTGNVPLVSGTPNAGGTVPFPATGGPTFVDFTGIPSWVKRVTLVFHEVSLASSYLLVQIGSSNGVETAQYSSGSCRVAANGGTSYTSSTSGFYILGGPSTELVSGIFTLTALGGSDTWVSSHTLNDTAACVISGGGTKTLLYGLPLDRVRITSSGGAALDSGVINILYE